MTLDTSNSTPPSSNQTLRVGIIGGGVSGATIALRLAALGVQTVLFEKKASLIDGPPMCHLHAGGNLYREIPDADCLTLLKQSIEMLRLYPYSIDCRPTLIAVPLRDKGNPSDLLPRLQLLTQAYQDMIAADIGNKVLGEPKDYYRLYSRADLDALTLQPAPHPDKMTSTDDWVSAAARQLDLDKLKYPLVAVMEYGWNIFRLAASAQRALSFYPNAHVLLDTVVTDVVAFTEVAASTASATTATAQQPTEAAVTQKNAHRAWQITYSSQNTDCTQHSDFGQHFRPHQSLVTGQNLAPRHPEPKAAAQNTIEVDYLINACGFRTGVIDDMVGVHADKMVEFKASYIAHWEAPFSLLDANLARVGNLGSNSSKLDTMGKVSSDAIEHIPNDTAHNDTAHNDAAPKTANHSNTTTAPFNQPDINQLGIKLPEIIIHGERGTPHGMVQLTPYPDGFYQIHSMSRQVTLFKDGLVKTATASAQPKLKPVYLDYIDKGWDISTLHRRTQSAIDGVSEFVPRFASACPTHKALYGGQQIPGVDDDSKRVADVSLYPELNYARAESVKASSALAAADDIVAQLQAQALLTIDAQQHYIRHHHHWLYLAHTGKQDIDSMAQALAKLRQFPESMAGVVTPYYPRPFS